MARRKLEIKKGRGKLVSGGDNYELFMDGRVIAHGRLSEMEEQKKDIEAQFPKDSAMDQQMFTVDVEFKDGRRVAPEFPSKAEAVAYAGRMAQDSAIAFSAVRGLAQDAYETNYKGFQLRELKRGDKTYIQVGRGGEYIGKEDTLEQAKNLVDHVVRQ
jgi:hypothetical protein